MSEEVKTPKLPEVKYISPVGKDAAKIFARYQSIVAPITFVPCDEQDATNE